MPKFIDMAGKKIGRLTVLFRNGVLGKGQAAWLCECECGKQALVRGDQLRNGHTQSCGCLQIEAAKRACETHGKTRENGKVSKIYSTWRGMKNRCNNPNFKLFAYYGGRGVKVCERWDASFDDFYADMGDPPTADHTLDRIDPNGDYAPENCRWATWAEQGVTKRSTRMVEIDGIAKPLAVWIREHGIGHATVYKRIAKGMSVVDAITTPPDPKFRTIHRPRLPG